MAGNRGIRKGFGPGPLVPLGELQDGALLMSDSTQEGGISYANPAPLGSLLTNHGGVYVGKRALDKWRYTIQPNRNVVIVGDSTSQGSVGGLDTWAERLFRDLGNWSGPRLTAGAGAYPYYRTGNLQGKLNGDREWYTTSQGAGSDTANWTNTTSLNSYNYAMFSSALFAANGTIPAARSITVVPASGSKTATSAALFVAADLGKLITGTGIPPNTYITKVTTTSSIQMSQPGNSLAASGTCIVHGASLTWTRPLGNAASRITWDSTTATDTSLVSETANFKQLDTGSMVTGSFISAGTYISSVSAYNTVVLNQATAGSTTSGFILVHDGRVVSDAVTATDTSLTSATAAFTNDDVFTKVVGTNIPAGTYIASVQSPTSATLSQATTGTGSSLFLFVQSQRGMRHVSDMATTAASSTVTSASAAFTTNDQGRHVTGTGIPNNTVISSVTNNTTVVLSNTILTTQSSGFMTIGSNTPVSVAAIENFHTDGVASNGATYRYSTDGGTTWVSVAQTSSAPQLITKTTVTVTNPTSFIICANIGTGTLLTKSQTVQLGIHVYQGTPGTAGINLYNYGYDGQTATALVGGGANDSLAMLDNGLGGHPGIRPDIIIFMFTNDVTVFTSEQYGNAIQRLIARTNSYADMIFMSFAEQSGRDQGAQRQFAAVTKRMALSDNPLVVKISDGTTTSSTTITSGGRAQFRQDDKGRTIRGTDIPAGTTITAVATAGSATISAAATGSTAGTAYWEIDCGTPDTENAYLDIYEAWSAEGVAGYAQAVRDGLMYDTLHPSQVGHNEIAGRISRIIRLFS